MKLFLISLFLYTSLSTSILAAMELGESHSPDCDGTCAQQKAEGAQGANAIKSIFGGVFKSKKQKKQSEMTIEESDWICSYATFNDFDEIKEKMKEKKLPLEDALTNSRCLLDSKDSTKPVGPMLHRTVNSGSYVFGVVMGVLRHIKSITDKKRRKAIFSAILDGAKGHRSLMQELIVSYGSTNDQDRKDTIVKSGKRICKAIEVFELEKELSNYVNDNTGGCKNEIFI